MTYGDRLKRAIRNRRKKTEELKKKWNKQHAAWIWRKARTRTLLAKYKLTKQPADYEKYHRSLVLQRVSREKSINLHHDVDVSRKKLGRWQRMLIKYRKKLRSGVVIRGNNAYGGTPQQRLVAVAKASAANSASGKRGSFYSQAGPWDVDHCISGEPRGHRSDCSSWFTSVYKSAGLSDPNGNDFKGGYTGTLYSHGKDVPASKREPGDAALYGYPPGHHVEMYIGNGQFIGHGSPPVDYQTPGLPTSYRRYL